MLCLVNLGTQAYELFGLLVGRCSMGGYLDQQNTYPLLLPLILSLFLFLLFKESTFSYCFSSHASQIGLANDRIQILDHDTCHRKQRPGIVALVGDSLGKPFGRLNQLARQLECELNWCVREVGMENYDLSAQILRKLRTLLSKAIAETRKMMSLLIHTSKSYSTSQISNQRIVLAQKDYSEVSDDVVSGDANDEVLIVETLHDDILPKLSAMLIGVQICESMLLKDSALAENRLIKFHRAAEDLKIRLKELQEKKHIDGLKVQCLEKTVRDFINDLDGCCDFTVNLTVDGDENQVSHQTKACLFAVVREAVVNLLKYASPKKVEIRLHFESDCAQASVIDDGKGFELQSAMAKSNLLGKRGLRKMKNSAETVGGTLVIDTAPQEGTKVVVSAPTNN